MIPAVLPPPTPTTRSDPDGAEAPTGTAFDDVLAQVGVDAASARADESSDDDDTEASHTTLGGHRPEGCRHERTADGIEDPEEPSDEVEPDGSGAAAAEAAVPTAPAPVETSCTTSAEPGAEVGAPAGAAGQRSDVAVPTEPTGDTPTLGHVDPDVVGRHDQDPTATVGDGAEDDAAVTEVVADTTADEMTNPEGSSGEATDATTPSAGLDAGAEVDTEVDAVDDTDTDTGTDTGTDTSTDIDTDPSAEVDADALQATRAATDLEDATADAVDGAIEADRPGAVRPSHGPGAQGATSTTDAMRRGTEGPAADAARTAPGVTRISQRASSDSPPADVPDRPSAEPAPTAMGAATPATPTTTTAVTAPAAPAAAPAPAPAVVDQLVQHVSPLLDGPDGTHELSIELRPAELGRVVLEVSLDDGVVHVKVHADDTVSRRLLADALPDLRHALERGGVRAGNLDVGNGAAGRPGERAPGEDRPGSSDRRPRPDRRTADQPPAIVANRPLHRDVALDVLL